MKAYLLNFSGEVTTDEVKALIDSSDHVVTWRRDMPNCFYLISESSAEIIAQDINTRRTKPFRFLVSEIKPDNYQGWLSPATWYLLRHKTHKPKGS